mgnify:CR=1 FL=1
MIINIYGSTNKDSVLIIQLPNVYFDRRYSYKVGLRHIHLELIQTDRNKTIHDLELLSLDTNLVDRSAANQTQSLFHFEHLPSRKMIQFSKVATVVYYTLHLYDLENATFEITRPFTSHTVDIENIFLQLEILKIDAYGRI